MFTRKAILASASAVALAGVPTVPAQAQVTPYLGQLQVFAGTFCPRGWSTASGQLLAISSNSALYSLLGTFYGGDGRTTFALPDARGRSVINAGTGPGLSTYNIGTRAGVTSVTLTESTMPTHSHVATVDANLPTSSQSADTNAPSGNSLATFHAGAQIYKTGAGDQQGMELTGSITLQNTGLGFEHENREPYIAMNWCIATQGLYPSRN